MIELENFSIGYGDKALLSNVSATIEKGSLTALFGRNGSGKSTLLRAIAGLNTKYSGRIVLDGHDRRGVRPVGLARGVAVGNIGRAGICNP